MLPRIGGVTGAGLALLALAYSAHGQQGGSTLPPPMYRIPASRLAVPAPSPQETFGYPSVSVDKRVVALMLRSGDYVELDRYLNGLQAAARTRIQLEYDFLDATRAFFTADSALGPLIDAWIAAAPASAHARTARATWYLAKAWHARGTDFANRTSATGISEMARYAQFAGADAAAALQLDSTHLIAYNELLRVLILTGESQRGRAVLDAGRRYHPGSYILPHQYMYQLQPRWGGSHEAMAAFAAEVAADSLLNPRLRTLLGAVDADLSQMAITAGQFDQAIQHATSALRYGPELNYLIARGHAYVYFNDNGRGVADLNAALAQRPQDPEALEYHAVAAFSAAASSSSAERQADLRQAQADFELILSFDPLDTDALKGLKDVTFEQQHCPDDLRDCGGSEVGAWQTLQSLVRDLRGMLALMGVLAFVSGWNFIKWARNGFWLPGYIHLPAVAALLLVILIDILWVRAGMSMTLRRWLAIPFFPGLVYFLFIGFGGPGWARRR